ncbi:MAG: primosomal protein N' [Armatimonadetes bacterium]|nr:primosomal protein N' [Armatimonadota bacterium]
MYARVVVDTEAASFLDSFTYEVPEHLIEGIGTGSCVIVPFGTAQAVGYVVAIEESSPVEKTKSILGVVDSPILLHPDLIRLSEWLSSRYICGLSRCANSVLPGVLQCRVRASVDVIDPRAAPDSPIVKAAEYAGGSIPLDTLRAGVPDLARKLRKLEASGAVARKFELLPPEGKRRTAAAVTLDIPKEEVASEIERLRSERATKQVEVLERVAEHGTIPVAEVAAQKAVSALVSKRILRRVQVPVRRYPTFTPAQSTAHVRLTAEQDSALEAAVEAIERRRHSVVLMHGVTASGKTEVYLRAIERARDRGLRSLVLLPEISLTTQILNIFRSRFGDRVAVLHSMLSAGERFDEWTRAQSGEVDVVLGARSAVFAPLTGLGVVIVDEEHEPTFKQDSDPRYHGRDVAIQRAEAGGALALLGSATPSVESYFQAKSGNYTLVSLRERVESRPMPVVTVADLRAEYRRGRATIFTEGLAEAIALRLAKKQQVILFQNRRAYATFLLCRECGYTAGCPNCAVSLKLHAAEKLLRCHHCEFEQPAPTNCPNCEGRKIGKFGIGTERIEEETITKFPGARVIRMDRDTTTRKGSHRYILDAFRKREADILVGTQMIAKGLDFPGVTLVGVISADTSLNLPDFRAGERTFQLLSQVAGRAGRGADPGEVVIQTFNPEHYAVTAAAAHDYEGFYEHEIALRHEMGYPPFSSLINVVACSSDEADARRRLNELAAKLRERSTGGEAPVELYGPVPAPIARLRGEYRWHVLIRCRDRDRLLRLVRDALDELPAVRRAVTVDVDPTSIM